MRAEYRIEHRAPDGAAAELMGTTCRENAVATAASWARWLSAKGRAGQVAVVEAGTGAVLRAYPVAEPPPMPAH